MDARMAWQMRSETPRDKRRSSMCGPTVDRFMSSPRLIANLRHGGAAVSLWRRWDQARESPIFQFSLENSRLLAL